MLNELISSFDPVVVAKTKKMPSSKYALPVKKKTLHNWHTWYRKL